MSWLDGNDLEPPGGKGISAEEKELHATQLNQWLQVIHYNSPILSSKFNEIVNHHVPGSSDDSVNPTPLMMIADNNDNLDGNLDENNLDVNMGLMANPRFNPQSFKTPISRIPDVAGSNGLKNWTELFNSTRDEGIDLSSGGIINGGEPRSKSVGGMLKLTSDDVKLESDI